MGAEFKAKVVIKRKTLPTQPINVQIHATKGVPGSDGGFLAAGTGATPSARPSTPAGGGNAGFGSVPMNPKAATKKFLPSSPKVKIKSTTRQRAAFK